MDFLNGLLTSAFDLLMRPVQGLNPWIGMCLATAFITIVLLLTFKLTSRPEAIRKSKGRLIARTLELVLFQQDMWVSLSAVGRILWANLLYLKELLIPLSVAIVFALPLLAQCAAWFESRPLREHERALLEVQMQSLPEGIASKPSLTVPVVVHADTQAITVPSRQSSTQRQPAGDFAFWNWLLAIESASPGVKSATVNWRVSGAEHGQGSLAIEIGGVTLQKNVVVGDGLARVSRRLPPASNYWDRLLYPSEPAVASSSSVKSVELHYPARNWYVDLPVIGFWDVNWLVAVFILSIVFGIILKKPLRVTL